MSAARLRRSSDIDAVRTEGRTLREAAFSSRSRPNDLGVVRLTVSAPRTLGGAVIRNRARRRIREAFRFALSETGPFRGVDMVVTARREALSLDFSALRSSAASVLRAAGEAG